MVYVNLHIETKDGCVISHDEYRTGMFFVKRRASVAGLRRTNIIVAIVTAYPNARGYRPWK